MLSIARTCLLSALLFGVAYGLARWQRVAQPTLAVQAQEDAARAGLLVSHAGGGTLGVPQWQDALQQQALDGRDLVSAVREILAQQEEDHCADTRIFALVECLPADRLGELVGLLEAFYADDFVHRFVLRAWAQRDVAGALNYMETHPGQRAQHLPDLLEGWTQRDPQAALAWVDGQHSATAAAALRTAVLGTIANTDPAGALEILQSKGWLAQTPKLLARIMQSYGAVKPADALPAMRSLLDQLMGENKDPRVASQNFQSLYRAMLCGLWQAGSTVAMAVAQQLTPEEQVMADSIFAEEITLRQPGGIQELLRGPLDEKTCKLLISNYREELLHYFAEIPNDEMRLEVLKSISLGSVSLSPAIMQFIEQRPKVARDGILEGLVSRGGNWTEKLPLWKQLSPESQSDTGPMLFKEYAAASPDLALAEFQKCPEAVQAACLRGMCGGMVEKQPQRALDLALMQTDPALRTSCLAGVLGFWSDRSQADAIKALEANATQIDLAAVLASLPTAGRFESKMGYRSYRMETTALQNRIREILQLPPATSGKEAP